MANAGCINAYDCNGCLIQTLQNLDSACIGVGVQYTAPNPLDDKRLDYIKYTDKCGCVQCLSAENEILIYATNGVIKNLTLTNDDVNEAIKIKWNDIFGSNRAKTIVRYKTGSYPVSITDGTLAVEETTKNQYSSTPFSLSGVLDETTYYITAFAVDSNNVVIGTQQTTITTDFGWKPSANTLARYKFENNANDYSGNGRNATNVGATFSSNGAYFSDYDKLITLPSMTIGTVFTISCWTKLTSNPTTNQEFEIYFDWTSSYRNLLFGLTATAIRGWTGNNSTTHNATITSSVSDFTNWHNYILVKNGTTLKLYKDGNLVSTGTSPYNVSIPGGRNTVYLGHSTMMTGSYQGAPGYLKDYIIENKDWAQSEVLEYYNKTKNHYA